MSARTTQPTQTVEPSVGKIREWIWMLVKILYKHEKISDLDHDAMYDGMFPTQPKETTSTVPEKYFDAYKRLRKIIPNARNVPDDIALSSMFEHVEGCVQALVNENKAVHNANLELIRMLESSSQQLQEMRQQRKE